MAMTDMEISRGSESRQLVLAPSACLWAVDTANRCRACADVAGGKGVGRV